MTRQDDLATRNTQVEDRAAIETLVHLYARGIRRGEADLCASLFTDDGLLESRDGTPADPEGGTVTSCYRGRGEILGHLRETQARVSLCPIIHNLMIELDGPRATGSAVMTAYILGTDRRLMGEYRDVFEKQDGRWLFASRIFTIWRGATG